MGKNPAFQFYPKDWLSDTELQASSSSTKGIWIQLLCLMWTAKTRGELSMSEDQYQKISSSTKDDIALFFHEVETLRFCYALRNDNGTITLRNRRMYREAIDKENNRLRQQRYRDKQKSNEEITPPSPSPSPSPKKKSIKKENSNNSFPRPDFITETQWEDILEHRKSVKARNSYRGLKAVAKQLKIAIDREYTIDECIDEMTNRSWRGFNADWMPAKQRVSNGPRFG